VRVLHTESRNILDLKVNGPYDNVSISHLLTFAAAQQEKVTHCVRAERERGVKFYVGGEGVFVCLSATRAYKYIAPAILFIDI